MSSKEMTYQYRLAQWARLAKERGELGVSIRTFCAMKGFAENTYFYWQRRLRAAACGELGMSRAGQTNLPASGFAEVRLSETSVPASLGQLRVEAGDIRITADSMYPAEKLAQLLRELAGSC